MLLLLRFCYELLPLSVLPLFGAAAKFFAPAQFCLASAQLLPLGALA